MRSEAEIFDGLMDVAYNLGHNDGIAELLVGYIGGRKEMAIYLLHNSGFEFEEIEKLFTDYEPGYVEESYWKAYSAVEDILGLKEK